MSPRHASKGRRGVSDAEGVLHRRSRESDGSEVLQVVVPQDLREALVLLAHKGPMAGHLGVHKILARLRGNYW